MLRTIYITWYKDKIYSASRYMPRAIYMTQDILIM